MNPTKNILTKIRKTVIIVIIFSAFPAFIATNFERGCYFCVAESYHVVDHLHGQTGIYGVTRDGFFRVFPIEKPCVTSVFQVLLYAGGLNSIEIVNNIVIVAGNDGRIFRSLNSNYNDWPQIPSGTTVNLNDVFGYYDSPYPVYVCGDSGVILKSTNLGLSFFRLSSGTTLDLNEIYGVDENDAWIAGDSALALHTTDAGQTWTQQFLHIIGEDGPPRIDLEAVSFINAGTGWMAGGDQVFKTTNGGAFWFGRFKHQQPYDNSSKSMFFYNSDSGIVVGNRGDIQFTTDGGISWFYSENLQGITTKNLNKFSYNDSTRIASVMGDSGAVIYLDSVPLGIEHNQNVIPGEYQLMQNYPNPFNPVTYIKFGLPERSFVKILVYDLLGREVEILIDKELTPGMYSVDWNASEYPSGIYFYRLETKEFSESKKMVLVK